MAADASDAVAAAVRRAEGWLTSLGLAPMAGVAEVDGAYGEPEGCRIIQLGVKGMSHLAEAAWGIDPGELMVAVSSGRRGAVRMSLCRRAAPGSQVSTWADSYLAESLAKADQASAYRRERWICERINTWQEDLPHLVAALLDDDGRLGGMRRPRPLQLDVPLNEVWKRYGVEVDVEVSPAVLLLYFDDEAFWFRAASDWLALVTGGPTSALQVAVPAYYAAMLQGMMADGYGPDDAELKALGLARPYLEWLDGRHGGGVGSGEAETLALGLGDGMQADRRRG